MPASSMHDARTHALPTCSAASRPEAAPNTLTSRGYCSCGSACVVASWVDCGCTDVRAACLLLQAPTVEGMSPSALEGNVGDYAGQISSSVCCAVDYFGPTDFLVMDEHSERDKGHTLVHDGPGELAAALALLLPRSIDYCIVSQLPPSAAASCLAFSCTYYCAVLV